MADPIRPLPPTPATAGPRPVSPQALAAQRAFFNAALGKASAPVAATPAAVAAPANPARVASPVAPAASADGALPLRYARPGSRLDITV